ncbi:S1C family serine protease [Lachnospiraceae bacterium ZAX-1]
MKLEVQLNQTKIESLKAFQLYDNRCHNMQKNTVFVIQNNTNDEKALMQAIEEIDTALTDCEGTKKPGYYRTAQLESFIATDERDAYMSRYEHWIAKKETRDYSDADFPFHFENSLWEETFKHAFIQITQDYWEAARSETKFKNFIITLFKRIDIYFPALFLNTKSLSKFPKMVYTGMIRTNEFLFFYLLALCGCDVYCVNPFDLSDVKWEHISSIARIMDERNQITATITAYDKSKILSEYAKKLQMPIRAASGMIDARDSHHRHSHPTDIHVEPTADEHVASENCTSDECTASESHTSTNGSSGENRTVATMRVLEYEELASMATSVVLITVYDESQKPVATGSGVLVNNAGYILTNCHVAGRGIAYGVRLEDDENIHMTSKLIKYHSLHDLALIRIEPVNRTPVPIYTGKKLIRGQKVIAIGSPLGLFNTVSDGIIAGFRQIHDTSMIQFTAPISSGSSGGALLNTYGQLIGIVTAGFDDGQNLNLAVDYEAVRDFLAGFI